MLPTCRLLGVGWSDGIRRVMRAWRNTVDIITLPQRRWLYSCSFLFENCPYLTPTSAPRSVRARSGVCRAPAQSCWSLGRSRASACWQEARRGTRNVQQKAKRQLRLQIRQKQSYKLICGKYECLFVRSEYVSGALWDGRPATVLRDTST